MKNGTVIDANRWDEIQGAGVLLEDIRRHLHKVARVLDHPDTREAHHRSLLALAAVDDTRDELVGIEQ